MKKIITVFLFFSIFGNVYSQSVAEPVKVFSWADTAHSFQDSISENFRKYLGDIIDEYNIDTINCIKIPYSESFELTNRKVINKSDFIWVQIEKSNSIVRKKERKNFEGNPKNTCNKVIIFYLKSDNSDFESIKVWSIYQKTSD